MARRLRKQMSLPETLLWDRIRRRAGGIKFRRQHPVAGYILDFYCASVKLAVEIDGEWHNRGDRPVRDVRRDAALANRGITVHRIAATDVLRDVDAVDAAADSILRAALPLHHRATPGGPPPHAMHGEDFPEAI
jgi:very-short-patch-repair endonuclease